MAHGAGIRYYIGSPAGSYSNVFQVTSNGIEEIELVYFNFNPSARATNLAALRFLDRAVAIRTTTQGERGMKERFIN